MSEKIDVERVERELVSALAADRKYSRENDAKIRAVTQRVATYDEFREIVKGSHLRPLEEKDTTGGGGFRQPWNTAACEKRTGGGGGGVEVALIENRELLNLQSFMREWRRLASQPHDQYRFLLQIGKDRLSQLFKVEISMGLLGDILSVMDKYFLSEDADSICGILDVLSQSSRFKLSIDFLSRKEKEVSWELFQKLLCSTHISDRHTSLEELSALYGHQLTTHSS